MPKLPPLYQQQRQAMGNHTIWQDDKQGSQQDQDQRVKRLARQAGLHTGSVNRQNVSHAMLQLISILSAAQISSANPAITPQRADELSSKNKTQYNGNDSSSAIERTVSIHYQSNNLPSRSTQKPVPALYLPASTVTAAGEEHRNAQPPLYSANISAINIPSHYETVSALKQKRSISPLENIPYDILTVMHDTRFDNQLRNTLDNIFRLAEHEPEVRYALKQEKNLYLLLKCIQQLQIFIIKNEHLYNGPAMLDALINLADNLDGPKEKVLVGKFKQQYLSEGAIKNAMLVSNSSIYDISQGRNLAGDIIILSPLAEERIISGEQTRHLNKLLEKNHYKAYKTPPLNRVNSLVDYLSGGVGKERINAVARVLLMPSGEYGSEKRESISDERKMAVIGAYMSQQIFGMSLEEWCIKPLQIMKSYQYLSFNKGYLEDRLFNVMNRSTNRGSLSPAARAFYKNNVLKKLLPTLTLQLNASDSEALSSINITQPRWGFIHAGAMLLNDSGAGLDGLTLADIEDAGISLHAMLSEGAVAKEYVGYFRLPALLCYVKDIYVSDLSMLNAQDLQQVYARYFDYINHWEKKNNPLARLPDLIQGWQTRTGLASEQLTRHSVSDEWLSSYLNSHSEAQFETTKWVSFDLHDGTGVNQVKYAVTNGTVTLPNIDTVFDEQNRQLADTAYEVDKLLLPSAFDSLSEEEQRFIEQSQVDRVRIQFNAMDSINKVPLSRHSRMGIMQSGALIFHISDHIDLLQCTWNGEERIYALETSKDTGKYTLSRVDRDRQELLWLLDDMTVPMHDPDYKLRVTSHTPLKSYAETPQKLIENLAAHHRKQLLISLKDRGYDKTTQEKVIDFLLGLLPFYTCITESLKGNERLAIPACIVDVAGLIPFAGQTAGTGLRFGKALAGSTAMALRYGALQTTIKAMVKQTNKQLIKYSPFVAEEISPQVLRGMGMGFLRGIDPGFELLGIGGAKGIRAMGNAFASIPDKSPGVVRLSAALRKKSAGIAAPDNTKLKIESLFSPAQGRSLDVAVVGAEGGKPIWAEVNRETGEFFGQKFIRNAKGDLEPIPFRLKHRKQKPAKVKGRSKAPASPQKKTEGIVTQDDGVVMIGPGLLSSKNVAKRYLSGTNYIQYYTKLPNNVKGSEVLVLSAHGGFTMRDTMDPVVVMPSDITIKMLTPHGTALMDPGLGNVVNAGKNLKAFVTIAEGKVADVDFLPQKGSAKWLFGDNYNPKLKFNTLGREEGLQNYRHFRYPRESDKLIARVLTKNRKRAEKGKAFLTDVLTVNSKISTVGETSLQGASVQKILDLDKAGKLLNEKGERYKTIVFSHCRAYFFLPDNLLSSYYMEPMQLLAHVQRTASKGSTIGEVKLTALHRRDVSREFEIQHYTVGWFIFTPVKQNMQSTMRPLELSALNRTI